MFYIISEPEYETSTWYKQIIDGLHTEKRKKRYSLKFIQDFSELKSCKITDTDISFVIGTNNDWILNTVSNCKVLFSNRIIVLGNHNPPPGGNTYSVVSGDIENDIRLLYSYLLSYGKKKIALYGINPDSTSDYLRKKSFLAVGGSESSLFFNDKSLKDCYEDFCNSKATYDGVICVNDFAAISLLKNLKKTPAPFIVSCGGTMLSMFFSPSITRVETNYKEFAPSAFRLAKMIEDNSINSINIKLKGKFIAGDTTDFLPLKNESETTILNKQKKLDKFYADSEIDEMLKVERLFNNCDIDDLLLLERVLSGKKYADIAKELFMSENGIKYRLKNMFKICEKNSKKEFITMLKKYIKV